MSEKIKTYKDDWTGVLQGEAFEMRVFEIPERIIKEKLGFGEDWKISSVDSGKDAKGNVLVLRVTIKKSLVKHKLYAETRKEKPDEKTTRKDSK